jgi:hypothetical protein
MTATLTFHQIVPDSLYNAWGGNAQQLANGNIEYDLCGVGAPTYPNSYVYEVTQDAARQTVWSMVSTGTNFYRAFRTPSLYPGVQWRRSGRPDRSGADPSQIVPGSRRVDFARL